ncbi:MAG: hypothetical protein ACRBBN_08720 [Methyloligellaceae bacterium]
MSFDHIVLFNLALLVAIASPGPAMLVAIQTSISEGKRAGIALVAVLALWPRHGLGMDAAGVAGVG